MKNKNPRSQFTLSFKQDAAKPVIEKGYTSQKAADSLGVSRSAFKSWVRAERAGTIEGGSQPVKLNLAEREELTFLRKERRNLLMERDMALLTK